MRFVLFSEMTMRQCMKALNDRIQANGTKTRPELDGWVEKSGRFSLALETPVFGRFRRKTRLRATAERENGLTVIRGFVPNGTSRAGLAIILVALLAVAVFMFARGEAIIAIAILFAGGGVSIPLIGDYHNHDVLLAELEKTLKAKYTPPKNKR